MSGLPCAKVIIDMGNRLTSTLQCMNASIVLNSDNIQPTMEMMDEFIRRAERLAQYAAEIEQYVGVGTVMRDTKDKSSRKDLEAALDYVAPKEDPKGKGNL
jgi:ketopantoate reductase